MNTQSHSHSPAPSALRASGGTSNADAPLATLKGSTRLITEFFEYSINAILYQRGVYPPEDFAPVRKYGLPLLRTHDPELAAYIRAVLVQVHRWVLGGKCSRLVLCVVARDDGAVRERWAFDVARPEAEPQPSPPGEGTGGAGGVPPAEGPSGGPSVQQQIRAVMRQITASVTFLPELPPGAHTFTVLAYTDAHAAVPLEWGDAADPGVQGPGAEAVQFRSFATGAHTVGVGVQYREDSV
ncbi:spindle checkpoint protein [Maudiozyma humilis]|uniref:Spindle checkpoint protein n=1 Tax=Maudiozyma humilis TaxID=51915 RepID=A0AAV5RT94_MAUHU|nr:spindle checkpoint protein [Kazachstania humilis]